MEKCFRQKVGKITWSWHINNTL